MSNPGLIKRCVSPPLVRAVQRPGSSAWPEPRPSVVDPSSLVDLSGVEATEFMEFQVELLHGANINDPAKWRGKDHGTMQASSLGSSLASCLGALCRLS